jgi:cellobiose phosphorylase
MPGNIDGPDSPHYGRAGWTWYTGSAAWYQKIIVDWILGIRAIEGGLLIDPGIPEEWDRFSVKRSFRGTEYFIEVKNDNHVSSGISKIILDGKESDSNIIKSCGKPKSTVEVFLG